MNPVSISTKAFLAAVSFLMTVGAVSSQNRPSTDGCAKWRQLPGDSTKVYCCKADPNFSEHYGQCPNNFRTESQVTCHNDKQCEPNEKCCHSSLNEKTCVGLIFSRTSKQPSSSNDQNSHAFRTSHPSDSLSSFPRTSSSSSIVNNIQSFRFPPFFRNRGSKPTPSGDHKGWCPVNIPVSASEDCHCDRQCCAYQKCCRHSPHDRKGVCVAVRRPDGALKNFDNSSIRKTYSRYYQPRCKRNPYYSCDSYDDYFYQNTISSGSLPWSSGFSYDNNGDAFVRDSQSEPPRTSNSNYDDSSLRDTYTSNSQPVPIETSYNSFNNYDYPSVQNTISRDYQPVPPITSHYNNGDPSVHNSPSRNYQPVPPITSHYNNGDSYLRNTHSSNSQAVFPRTYHSSNMLRQG